MLLSRDAIAAAVEVVAADDFYKPAHGHIFDAITSLFAAGEPADPVTVAEELSRAGLLDAIGGPATLVTIQAATPATTSAARYARIVEEHALLRRLIGVAGEIAELGYDIPDDVSQGGRPGRGARLPGRPASGVRHPVADPRPPVREPRPARAALRAGRGHHRRAHRLHRSRRAAVGHAAQRPHRRRRQAGNGQDEFRARRGHARGVAGQPAGVDLQPGDEPDRGQPADPVLRGKGRLDQGPHREAEPGRLDPDQPRRRPAGGGADLRRRQPERVGASRSGPRPAGSRAPPADSAS